MGTFQKVQSQKFLSSVFSHPLELMIQNVALHQRCNEDHRVGKETFTRNKLKTTLGQKRTLTAEKKIFERKQVTRNNRLLEIEKTRFFEQK